MDVSEFAATSVCGAADICLLTEVFLELVLPLGEGVQLLLVRLLRFVLHIWQSHSKG